MSIILKHGFLNASAIKGANQEINQEKNQEIKIVVYQILFFSSGTSHIQKYSLWLQQHFRYTMNIPIKTIWDYLCFSPLYQLVSDSSWAFSDK